MCNKLIKNSKKQQFGLLAINTATNIRFAKDGLFRTTRVCIETLILKPTLNYM